LLEPGLRLAVDATPLSGTAPIAGDRGGAVTKALDQQRRSPCNATAIGSLDISRAQPGLSVTPRPSDAQSVRDEDLKKTNNRELRACVRALDCERVVQVDLESKREPVTGGRAVSRGPILRQNGILLISIHGQ